MNDEIGRRWRRSAQVLSSSSSLVSLRTRASRWSDSPRTAAIIAVPNPTTTGNTRRTTTRMTAPITVLSLPFRRRDPLRRLGRPSRFGRLTRWANGNVRPRLDLHRALRRQGCNADGAARGAVMPRHSPTASSGWRSLGWFVPSLRPPRCFHRASRVDRKRSPSLRRERPVCTDQLVLPCTQG
jgi:hypothetical protein